MTEMEMFYVYMLNEVESCHYDVSIFGNWNSWDCLFASATLCTCSLVTLLTHHIHGNNILSIFMMSWINIVYN